MFKLVSWNLNGASAKFLFLQLMCDELSPMLSTYLQETKLSPSRNFFLKNYKVFRHDPTLSVNASGAVLIAKRDSIHSRAVPLTTPFQTVTVQTHSSNPVTFCSLYRHHSDVVTLSLLEQLTKQLPNPFVLTGDFNAHHYL